MPPIQSIQGQKILDSSGLPTLEVTVVLDDGSSGVDSVPAGLHTGRYEAVIIENIDQAINNIDTAIAPALVGRESMEQETIDRLMIEVDGSPNKSNIGGNTILGVSLALARATAMARKQPLFLYIQEMFGGTVSAMPIPIFNIIDGGKHADNRLPFQEFVIIPEIEGTFEEKLMVGHKVFTIARKILERMGQVVAVGEEGGFAPKLQTNEEALEVLVDAIMEAGYRPKEQVSIGIDVAASAIPDLAAVTYPYRPLDYYGRLIKNYPISILEDPLKEDDWESWAQLTQSLGSLVAVVGDDLFSTNLTRLRTGIEQKAANGISIKPNQIGTVTETLEAIRLARQSNMNIMVSHRARETEDTFIADLSVGTQTRYIKAGAQNRGERIAKYNQLLRIDRVLNSSPLKPTTISTQ